ncbi:hypothetical protein TTHERM_00894440 (macronuclear) [Tetrahymena thermophila SB210]|uniref:Uncharacterized protein n=1 Tax=Tetrahymena thermophila (strain SB210) TaxID=312017 RepID=Q23U50_TETTS|nr:hypothetical protein TTHERM_00894440 [Tetrahymena thermophila SB210]EAS00094.2 hypothetical protein TTHERM_00894440 [Tetrahymena thermophila SB210]|eukprot:XP_001020339.2 hypothetical protein TTHERM_00894440 [Tetrahymena thermophila SB210]
MSSQELMLIDEFLNFKDFSNSKKSSKNQELGPWGTPQDDQDIFCYRKRLEETSALTNKATKKHLKQDLQSANCNHENIDTSLDKNSINLSFQQENFARYANSQMLPKNKKVVSELTYQLSQTSQRSDLNQNQENKLYQSAEIDTSYFLRTGLEGIKQQKKHQSVGRTSIQVNYQNQPSQNFESKTQKYEIDLDRIKKLLKDQNESQKLILLQGSTKDIKANQFENFYSTLALMPEGTTENTQNSMIHSNNQTQQILSRPKKNMQEQRRANSNDLRNNIINTNEDDLDNSINQRNLLLIENQKLNQQKMHQYNINLAKEKRMKRQNPQSNGLIESRSNYADPKQRINIIREQLNMFEEGKKKFEKVLKICRISSMTPEQPLFQRNEQNVREYKQKLSKDKKQNIYHKKYQIYDFPTDKQSEMFYDNKSRMDSDVSTNSMFDYRKMNFKQFQQNQQNNQTNDQTQTQMLQIQQERQQYNFLFQKEKSNLQEEINNQQYQEANKLPRLQNINSKQRVAKNKASQRNKICFPLNEYYLKNSSPSSLANKLDINKIFPQKKQIIRSSDVS